MLPKISFGVDKVVQSSVAVAGAESVSMSSVLFVSRVISVLV